MSKWILVILCILLNKNICTYSCYYDSELDKNTCYSFDELEKEGNDKWVRVMIRKLNETFPVNLKSKSFNVTPNLKELSIYYPIKEIEPAAFKSLNKLDKLVMADNYLTDISPEVFDGLSISILQLTNNNMRTISPGSFKNLPNIKIVYIDKNYLKRIKAGIFNGTRIRILYLIDDGIEIIEAGAFLDMSNLLGLHLSGNRLTSFDSRTLLGDRPSLTHLWLSRNKLTKLTNDMFTTIPYLEQLFLEINQIESVEQEVFINITRLEFLDLSNNLLEEIEPRIFPTRKMEYLGALFLHNNRLTFINTVLLTKAPKLKYVTLGGNPFQCPCLTQVKIWINERNVTELCRDIFYSGKNPSCVTSLVSPKTCVYDAESHKDLFIIYSEALNSDTSLKYLKCDTIAGFERAKLVRTPPLY